jgi:hypothetical protein
MSGDIIVGIDNLSLILLGLLLAIEIYGFITSNDVLLIVGLVAIVLVYIVRIRNRRVNRQESLAPSF